MAKIMPLSEDARNAHEWETQCQRLRETIGDDDANKIIRDIIKEVGPDFAAARALLNNAIERELRGGDHYLSLEELGERIEYIRRRLSEE